MQLNELFGIFRNNEKYEKRKAEREESKARTKNQTGDEPDEETDEEENKPEDRADPMKKRSNSTKGTQSPKKPGDK